MNASFVRWLFAPLVLSALFALIIGCTQATNKPSPLSLPASQLHISTAPLALPATCANTFVTHALDHITLTHTQPAGLYESNGAGVAINDLDGDGDLDIVLANLRDPNTILWNQTLPPRPQSGGGTDVGVTVPSPNRGGLGRGELRFQTEHLTHGDSRAVNIVDVDGDGRQDIVFTRRLAKPTYWRNTGEMNALGTVHFVEGILPDVNNPFYTMNWGDLDGDGDLDLVAASYDTELRKEQGAIFDYRGGGVGVFVYTQQEGSFVAQRLTEQADTLAIALADLNRDGKLDLLVGNDFNRPDYTWLRGDNGWAATNLFKTTTENTMSLDIGDIDNDGRQEIFATDMKPYRQDVRTLASWLPMMNKMTRPSTSADPQTVENVLQVQGTNGRFYNRAYQRLLDATGWSWSSKFGDLDNDGFLDIYVVNGMIAEGILAHLPGNELVEENQVFHNDGQGYFTPVPAWGLSSTASGRGMSMADLDNDGDLDIVVNNLMTPAQLFENQLCGGTSIEVDLRWSSTKNPYAIGARLALHTNVGTYYRDVRVASGYLSGDPARIHIGLPSDAILQHLAVIWPDGALSKIESLEAHTLITVERNR